MIKKTAELQFGCFGYAKRNKLRLILLHMIKPCLDGAGELIAAGGRFAAAGDAGKAFNGVFSLHAFNKTADALQVAGAAADEADVMEGLVVVIDFKKDFG